MSQPDWPEVEQVMAAALDLPEEERASYIACRCADRPEVHAEVESLLAADRRAGRFLQAETGRAGMTLSRPASLVGRHIGPYRLLEEIGRGGMGAVYRAERDDGRFQKQVAVKVTAAAINSPELLRRFRDEQQILATLEHPNIARLLDAGVSGDGLPYIVMEYVAGVPIHQYCSEQRLPVVERLRLFRTICSAVHYAHQHLVVHRDLKPGNILVTAEGAPKLLDFGIAKILARLPEALSATAVSLLNPLTPDYASPEQVQGASITTVSDVYSLGVLLYELLTGKRPYDLAGKTLDEALRLICETEPPKASAAAPLPADLDAIVAKAMRKEPEQRYASAEELSTDVGRYLTGLPVWAHRGSSRYVARKFVVRHRFGVATALLVGFLAAGGAAAIVRQARIAERERARAERRFQEVRQLANSVLFELHDKIATLAGATEVRKLLVTRALHYLDSLSREAEGNVSLLMELAAAYTRVGEVQSGLDSANLRDTGGALGSFGKAREILHSVVARDPARQDARKMLAAVCMSISGVHLSLRKNAPAVDGAREAVGIWQALAAQAPGDEEVLRRLAEAYFRIGSALAGDDPKTSIENRDKAINILQALLDTHPDSANDAQRVQVLKALGDTLKARGEDDKAMENFRKARELDEKRVAAHPEDPVAKLDLSFDLAEIADWHLKRGGLRQALAIHELALETRRALAQADPRDARMRGFLAYAYIQVGAVLARIGDSAAAAEHFRKAAELCQTLLETNPADNYGLAWLAQAQAGVGTAEADLAGRMRNNPNRMDHSRTACSFYRRALVSYRELQARGVIWKKERETAERMAQEAAQCGMPHQ